MLWLAWLDRFLDVAEAFAPLTSKARAIGHAWLDGVARLLSDMIVVRMARALPRRAILYKHKRAHLGGKRSPVLRAAIGSDLRRRFRRGDLRRRIAALRHDLDALAARRLRQLRRGLTRRAPTPPACERVPLALAMSTFAPAFSFDTS